MNDETIAPSYETEALRPDREKIQEFQQWLIKSINYPIVKNKEAQLLLSVVDDKLDDIFSLITNWLNDPSVLLAYFDNESSATTK